MGSPARGETLLLAAVAAELGGLPGVAIGVGLVPAALGAMRAMVEHRPGRVVLVGSAGAFPGKGLGIGEAVVGRRLGLGAPAAALGLGYLPVPPTEFLGPGSVDVLTNLAITTDEALAAKFAEGWDVEHMEAWGVAAAAAELDIPLVVVLGISNLVGPGAHAAWKANRGRAEDAARRRAREILAGGPDTSPPRAR